MNMKMILAAPLLAVSACGPSAEDHPAGATPYTGEEKALIERQAGRIQAAPDYNRLVFADHCVNGLSAAGERSLVDPERSALVFPWDIRRVGGSDGLPTLECAVTDRDKVRFVTVEAVCDDTDRSGCSRFIGIAEARAGG